MKVHASGICGSDVMEWYRIKKAPLVLGHEIAGVIEEVGEGVERFKVGDRVTAAHHVPCNECKYCKRGAHSVCETLRTTTFYPGGFAEFVRVPAINVKVGVFKLPDTMSFVEGSFSEPLGCVVRGMRVSGFKAGESVLVIGSGISGILHIKLARALGASFITAVDVNEKRLEQAKEFGADLALMANEDIKEALIKSPGGLADFVAICAGADSAITTALNCVDRGGKILFFAPKEPGETFPMPLFDLWRDNITLVNSYAAPPVDTLAAIELIGDRRVSVEDMVSHKLSLDEAAEGFKLVAEATDSLKVIIEP
ncbi:MAG: alcohol dehydrogenase catalytic domain-containing protein [Proteobacteria bacterium]|nr:alcohol dehydrogenase catalytic domain-containing protein [Pseudomonadota bacterium]